MNTVVQLPLWLFVLIVLFAAVTFASHFLFPSVRWFFRRRLEKAVKQLNTRLTRPIEPFKLARRYDMIQRLIYDPEVTREIVNYARENHVPENVAFQKARTYAREIVPSFSAFAYFSFGIRLARLLANSLYVIRTGPRNDDILRAIPKDATVVFIMNHRSNMDYMLVTYLAARASALSYAVGEWARVWPLSRLIKSMGAYFIRRRSRGALYRRVLARYVQMATAGGVTQAIFPEGGLSLNGRLMPPKMGLLAYVVEGYQADGRDVVFVPVAINYDRVLEDSVLIAAAARGDRRFGARISVVVRFILRKLWQFLRGRYKRFGTAAVAFGEPVSLRDFGPDRPLEDLSRTLMTRIEAAMPVLFVPLTSWVLQQAGGPLSDADLLARTDAEARKLPARSLLIAPEARHAAIEEARDLMVKHAMIEQGAGGWRIAPGKQATVAFYANSIAHYFAEDAAAAE
ncbi:1-acyl-sn-glycerol-3-phosphate acyltransferase [Sulfitobacter sabulilitoris]|uniref:Glycerol-3-phosphate acyltransferase n=1 Tax=Sulfitobacter sabulilitoris TaxID=2562655 RepID=A0A5S3PI51_9RHOB|nr:1-acyl-sn-glycerol-3-phosphate acyltransferase [Sulfitobacter sabulilitoris]TMM51615.1 glycerol-3-phosphate acyltransferase [Sulfitobacter sabulilitoris]